MWPGAPIHPDVRLGIEPGLLPTGELLHAGTHKRGSHLCRLLHGHIVREQYGEMRFSVTSPVQNAPFGHVEVASPAQSAVFREVASADCAFT